jgi:inhibitor of cysteine peptidase
LLEITEAMNGSQAEVALGDQFAIRLGENPTTGYRWNVQEIDQSAFEFIDDSFKPSTGSVGAGGNRRWLMRAKLAGDFPLAFEKKRSWEQSGVETFTVTIRVRSGHDEQKHN